MMFPSCVRDCSVASFACAGALYESAMNSVSTENEYVIIFLDGLAGCSVFEYLVD